MAGVSLGPVQAVCDNPSANWTFDDQGKDPCQVATALAQACVPELPPIPPLLQGNAYSGPPDPDQSNQCICSSVTYSMISACAYCQNGLFRNWAGDNSWSQNCTPQDLRVGSYPLPISKNFSVPIWAYINVTESNSWDFTASHDLAGSAPDVSGQATPTFSTQTPDAPPTGLSVPTQELPTFTPPVPPPKQKSDVGSVVGGVIGGLVGILACLIAAFMFIRYQSRRYKPKASPVVTQFNHQSLTYRGVSQSYSSRPTSNHRKPILYDPSDPSTFPVTPAPTVPTISSSSDYSDRSTFPSNQTSGQSQTGLLGQSHVPTYPNVRNGREWVSTPVPEI